MSGIKEEAEENLAHLLADSESDTQRINFYKAAITTCEGIVIYSERLSHHAKQLAEKEPDGKRKKELEKIAEINARVPAHPPKTFQEALQAVWTILSLFLLEYICLL